MDILEAKALKQETEERLTHILSERIQLFMDQTGLLVEEVVVDQIVTRTIDSNEDNLIVVGVHLQVRL